MDVPAAAPGRPVVDRAAERVGEQLCVSATAAMYLYPRVVEAYRRYQQTWFSGDRCRDAAVIMLLLEVGRSGRDPRSVDLHELWLQTAPTGSAGAGDHRHRPTGSTIVPVYRRALPDHG